MPAYQFAKIFPKPRGIKIIRLFDQFENFKFNQNFPFGSRFLSSSSNTPSKSKYDAIVVGGGMTLFLLTFNRILICM